MKTVELRAKSKEELKDLVVSLKKEQFNLRMQAAVGALESQGRFKEIRRSIARAKTLLSEDPAKLEAAKAKVKKEKVKKPKAEKAAAKKPAKKTAKKPASKAKKG